VLALRFTAALLTILALSSSIAFAAKPPTIATFSVVAYDPRTGEVGVAVQSRFFAVGSVVPYAEAGVGAVATQAFGQTTYGPRILELLAAGFSPAAGLGALLDDDAQAAQRQLGVVSTGNDAKIRNPDLERSLASESNEVLFFDMAGRIVPGLRDELGTAGSANAGDAAAVTWTGSECLDWAGGIAAVAPDGVVYCVQGNILHSEAVVKAMAAYMDNPTDIVVENMVNQPSSEMLLEVLRAIEPDDLAGRMLGAMVAGQLMGGDTRGMQSAALKVNQAGAGYGGYNDVKYDLRVDDAPDPFYELARLLNQAYTLLTAGDTAKAVELFRELAELQPQEASHHYNLACGLSRAGELDRAMASLRIALELDDKLRELAQSDPDLENLRGREDYKALVETP
jgi:uncharacterized Ntn-hydrolase superfamily protein